MVSLQKKLAAKILKCGIYRVWIDPNNPKVRAAITRNDVRGLIKDGYVKKLPVKKRAKKQKKKQQKIGSRKGSSAARIGKKGIWLKTVRAQRKLLRELKSKLKPLAYRKVYRMVKGNSFRNKKHLETYLKEKKLFEE